MHPRPLPPPLGESPFTVHQGRLAGLTKDRMLSGDLARPYRGVRSRAQPGSVVERCHAYSARMSDVEFFCSATAALLHGIPLPGRHERDDRIHVAVPNPHRAPRGEGVIGHKFIVGPGEIADSHGLRASTIERAWCELGTLLSLDELVVAGDHIIRPARALSTRAALADMLERYPDRRGQRGLRRALLLLDGRSESPGETRLRVVLITFGLAGFELNHPVAVPGTKGGYRLDIAFVKERVALEYQGAYHADEAQWRADMTRISRLEAMGWHIIQVNKDDLRDPAELASRIRTVLASRS